MFKVVWYIVTPCHDAPWLNRSERRESCSMDYLKASDLCSQLRASGVENAEVISG